MAFSDPFRQQHDQATLAARRLRELVHDHRPGHATIAIATQLARLFSVLRYHFAEEERCLYRALTATRNRNAAALARRFHQDMGSLAWDWEEFMQRWSSSTMIALDFAGFEYALGRLLAALDQRIECENGTLYPVADARFPELQGRAA